MTELTLLREGGVVGGGGAGFPLWKKLASPAETLLINGAECEPLLRCDQYLMLRQAETLALAADRLKAIANANRAVICLKDHYHEQRRALEDAIRSTGARVELHDLPTAYPIGDEQAVVRSVTGRTVPPGALPGAVGCTVVSVSTAINAYFALSGKPVTRRLVTVAGEVARPGLYSVAIGAPVSAVLMAAGGVKGRRRLVLGGPMMGQLLPEGEDPPVLKTCGGILALPMEHPLVLMAMLPDEHVRNRALSVCIQCRTCTDMCPRFLSGHPIYPHLSMRAFAMGMGLEKSAALCMDCGVCELYACPMGLSPRRVQRDMKEALRASGERPVFSLIEPNEFEADRRIPSSRLALRLSLSEYEIDTPRTVAEVAPARVCIPLRQHIGTGATACVRVGDIVSMNQAVGRMADGALGADVHASIDGRVTAVTGDAVTIEGRAGA